MTVVGSITRGTTARGRLRRLDRWLTARHRQRLLKSGLLVVDLGFGASPVTTIELAARVHRINPSATIVGLDIDPARVAAAQAAERRGVSFALGGFELAGLRPDVVRACNVLRQYDETAVADAWRTMQDRLSPGGVLVEGTVDEVGRLGAWVTLDEAGPQTLTVAVDLARAPSAVAARLPKILIHRNVPGHPVHDFLHALDAGWARHAALRAFGVRQRFAATVGDVRRQGWPVLDGPRRWRRGDATVRWAAVARSGD